MSEHIHEPAAADDATYCEVHPDRETGLRCNKCGRYMCAQCATQTPVGYRCRECVRQQDQKFFKGSNNDNLIAFGVSFTLTAVAAGIFKALGAWLLLALIIGFPLGAVIGEGVLRATSRRRTMNMNRIAAAGAVVGGLVGGFAQTYLYWSSVLAEQAQQLGINEAVSLPFNFVFDQLFRDWGFIAFVGIVAFAIYGRFRFRL